MRNRNPEFPMYHSRVIQHANTEKLPQFLGFFFFFLKMTYCIQMTACTQLHKHLFSDTILTLVQVQLYTHRWKVLLVYWGVVSFYSVVSQRFLRKNSPVLVKKSICCCCVCVIDGDNTTGKAATVLMDARRSRFQ